MGVTAGPSTGLPSARGDRPQNDTATIGERELVISGRQSAPLLGLVEAALRRSGSRDTPYLACALQACRGGPEADAGGIRTC